MNIVSLDEMKGYLRLLDDYEDSTLLSFIAVAEEYVKNATGFKFNLEVPEIAKLIVKLLVSHWYENRAIVSTQTATKLDFTVTTLLNQLNYAYTVEQIDGVSE